MGSETFQHGCLRRAVITYNAFFWVTGPGVIGLGIWLYIAIGEYEPVVERAELSLPAFLIISAGGASLLAGLFGCLGSLNENRRLLVLYSVLMLMVCTMETTAAVFCFLTYSKEIEFDASESADQLGEQPALTSDEAAASAAWQATFADTRVQSMLNDSISEYGVISDVTNVWDSIHVELSCCGVQSAADWLTTPVHRGGSLSLQNTAFLEVAPLSCCVLPHNATNCNHGNPNGIFLHPEQIYQKGCGSPLADRLRHIYIIVGWTVASVAASMILALSAVCCLKHAVSGY